MRDGAHPAHLPSPSKSQISRPTFIAGARESVPLVGGGIRERIGLSHERIEILLRPLSSSSNPTPASKAVSLLIGSTLLLIGVNLAILIVVFLPPKRKFVEGVVVFVGVPPVAKAANSMGLVGSCETNAELNWASGSLSLSTNASRKELREARDRVGAGLQTSGLSDVVVRIVPPLPASLRPVESTDSNRIQLTALDCGFHPRFIAIGTNESLRLINSNSTLKTLVAFSSGTNAVLRWTPSKLGQLETVRFAQEESFVRLQPADNPALHGVIAVMGHPYYAMVDADGVFRLPGGLPDEDFTLEAIHPTLGRREIRVQPRRPSGPLVIRFGAE